MRYYLDTEFLDDAVIRTVELISLALVCEDGRELYLVNSEFDRSRADDWLNANVMPQLPKCVCPGSGTLDHLGHTNPDCLWRTRAQMRDAVAAFILVEPKEEIEIWAYFASYDWLCLVQLFGKMIELPKHFPWLVNDLKTWAKHIGYTGKFRDLLPDSGHHIALEDARWNRDVHKILLERQPLKALADALVDARASEGAQHEATPLATVMHLSTELLRDYASLEGQLRDIELRKHDAAQREGTDPIVDEILSRTKKVEIV